MDALRFYDIQDADQIDTLALGKVTYRTSADSLLRVQNTSDLYQAEDVEVSIHGDDAIQLWLSVDGDNFYASIAIGDIPPNGDSQTFWLRRVTPSTADTGGCTAVLRATPAAWSNPVDTTTSTNIAITED